MPDSTTPAPGTIRTVLFDLDGTLLDTAPDLAAALNAVLIENNRPALPFDAIRPVVSHGGIALIKLGFDLEPSDPGFDPLRQRLLEIYRDMCSDLRDYYSTTISNRMNEVMQVLTVISAIFIPLSFITGLYGMNFDRRSPWNLPELSLRFGYLYCLGAMSFMSLIMIFFFRRRGWLGGRRN